MDIVIQGNRFGAFEILEHVNLDFQVVFITGNSDSEYYSKAIKMHCLDFIIKPTSIDDFAGPLARAWEKKHESQQQIERTIYIKQLEQFIDAFKKRQTNPPIPIPVEYGHIIIKTDDIIKCVSEGNYTEFFLADHSKKIANGNLKHFELYLSEYNIIRIHRKCMINLLHISLYQKKEGGIITLSNGDIVYVGDVWRTSFEKAYNTFFHISDTSA